MNELGDAIEQKVAAFREEHPDATEEELSRYRRYLNEGGLFVFRCIFSNSHRGFGLYENKCENT